VADFFEKVKQRIDKGVTTVSVRSKEALEATRVKSQMSELQKRRTEALEELGNIVYTQFAKNQPDDERVRKRCSAIAELDRQIREKEEELRAIHVKAEEQLGKPAAIGRCDCGADIQAGTKFCGTCGAKVGLAGES
jgi:NADH pyrophosphatase NudC (nudix superfamily)